MIRSVFLVLSGLLCFGAEIVVSTSTNSVHEIRLREVSDKFRTEQIAIHEKLLSARQFLEQAAQAETSDEKNIRAKATVIGQLEGDLAVLRAKYLKEVRAIRPQAGPTNRTVRLIDIRSEPPDTKALTLPSAVSPGQPHPAETSAR